MLESTQNGRDGHGQRHNSETVTISWASDDLGYMVRCDDVFLAVMRTTRKRVIGKQGTPTLRPGAASDDSHIRAIWEAKQRLKNGETTEEHITSWIENSEGTHIPVPDAVMTYNKLYGIYPVVAEVDAKYLPTTPTLMAIEGPDGRPRLLRVEGLPPRPLQSGGEWRHKMAAWIERSADGSGNPQQIPRQPESSHVVSDGVDPPRTTRNAGRRHATTQGDQGRVQPMSTTTEPVMENQPDLLLDREEMAARLKWSTAHLDRIATLNRGFPIQRNGRKVQFDPAEVLEFLNECARTGRVLISKPEKPKRGRK